MKDLDYGKGYRYAYDEQQAYAAGETYLRRNKGKNAIIFPLTGARE